MPLTPVTIATALRAPAGPVEAIWPLIVAGLEEFGINSLLVQVAAAATVMTECSSWVPCAERHADPNRQPALWQAQERYWPSGFYGRGLIQTTLEGNYLALEKDLGIPLTTNPDLLLEPAVAARALAHFFAVNHVADAANLRDWLKVRVRVNGINRATGLPNGWVQFQTYISSLMGEVNG